MYLETLKSSKPNQKTWQQFVVPRWVVVFRLGHILGNPEYKYIYIFLRNGPNLILTRPLVPVSPGTVSVNGLCSGLGHRNGSFAALAVSKSKPYKTAVFFVQVVFLKGRRVHMCVKCH